MKLSVNGHDLWAYTGGKPFDPSLPCVVFIHGALHDHSVWTLLARWFAHHGHAVLAPDLPGHGRSGGPPPDSVESAADTVLAALQQVGVQRAAFVGHSMGSLIALEAAARAPDRARQLVLVATAYPMAVSDALLKTAAEAPLKAIDMVNAFSISSIATKPGNPGPGTWYHGANRALMRRMQSLAERRLGLNLFLHDFNVCNRYAHGLEAAAAVRCPATLLLGERDQMTLPKATKGVAEALQARVVTLPSGHVPMAEVPDAALGALRAALD